MTGTLTLDGGGDPDATFVFQAGTSLTTAADIVLIDGAQARNVYWQVGSPATLGTASKWQGNSLALTSITLVDSATLIGRAAVDAQERGTVEFGVFGSGGSYDNGLDLDSGWGGGGRVGAFLFPRLSVEFEARGSSAAPTLGAGDNVNVGVLSGRLTAVPLQAGRLSLLAGLGVDHTDAFFLESYRSPSRWRMGPTPWVTTNQPWSSASGAPRRCCRAWTARTSGAR